MNTIKVEIGSRIKILKSRNPARIGAFATIVGERRAGRSVVSGLPNYVHPIAVDGIGETVNGKPICVEDGTFEVISGKVTSVRDCASAAFVLKLQTTGSADGIKDDNGVTQLDEK